MDIDTVADELYALRPEHFTAARNARMAEARTAGDRALAERIGALRRPSLAAWVSNLLVRERPEEVEALLRLGEGLRQAHQDLDGARLRELTGQQRTLIRAVSREARQLATRAGHPVGEDVGREVEGTLHAVLADPEAAAHWATGHLVRPLEATVGFPEVSPTAAPRPPARPRKGRDDEALTRARKDAEAAERALRALEKEAATAEREAAESQQRTARLKERVGELTEELGRAKADHRQASEEERRVREELRATERRVREARRRAETAAARLEGHPSALKPAPRRRVRGS
ncbi:hypothetical protein BN159_0753 [Streptomyces davaonensis JCM 4913]|uniref:Uncharacterized protein n=1 Tax=Streptomyces davaonensis (strain DSM 101723 / JCM 4913 / KCC S-0913 / 768) TaxID=1214101 RepID=K4QW17_STRDJ|nr:hypothetical protein [Streptomyces davaonensis]CCK25132.1 hypothetical protein BN159_0753 [Streptomyces davaonensis JCM 4913]